MLTFATTSKYRRERKLAERRGRDMNLLDTVINTLLEEKRLTLSIGITPSWGIAPVFESAMFNRTGC
jgi:hypothetical protein